MSKCNLKLETNDGHCHLKLETDEQVNGPVLIPVLKEAEFPRHGPQRGRDGGAHWRRGESGTQGGASREKPRSTSISERQEDEAEDKQA